MRAWRAAVSGLLGGLLLCAALAGAVLAWDTKEAGLGADDKGKWVAIYACLGGVSRFADVDCSHNEHEQLADIALRLTVGQNNEWTIAGASDLAVVDLNASLHRPELKRRGTWPQGGSKGLLETRALADPPHFAGLPDFSYSLYDWVNKNAYCPPLPAGRQDDPRCHVYGVYHGAMFNSSHWARQDELNYRRLHAAALNEARRARALREAVEASPAAGDARAHRDTVREAEFLAMALEGYAQHFLQDRWAMGHMWNRWGGPDHVGYPYWDQPSKGGMVGGMVGIIHGAEAVVGYPDAMSSPAPQRVITGAASLGLSFTDINQMQWTFPGEGKLHGGVGDYRAEALLTGVFGKDYLAFSYQDWALDVEDQRGWLMSCSAGGWGEVIRAMGPNRRGGYGLQGAPIGRTARAGVSSKCFAPLATNRSMRDGWGFNSAVEAAADGSAVTGSGNWDMLASIAVRVVTMYRAGEVRGGDALELVPDRAALAKITHAIAFYGHFYPDGTDLASGRSLPDFGDAKTSDQYPIASYFEPADLKSLPEQSPNGRDRQAMFGFFNRAHAGHYCAKAMDKTLFEDLRGSARPEDQAACRYLAERVFAGTPADYAEGHQAEGRRVGGADGAAMSPICALQPDPAERVKLTAYDKDVPYFIHPGYVAFDPGRNMSLAHQPHPQGYSPLTVGHWCEMKPVLDTLADPAKRVRDIVGELTDPDARIVLAGENLGREGELRIGRTLSESVAVKDVRSWRDNRIEFTLGALAERIAFNGEDEAYVFVSRLEQAADARDPRTMVRVASVGRFVLKKDLAVPKLVEVEVKADGRRVYSDKAPAPGPADVAPGAAPPPFVAPPPGAFRPVGPDQDLEIALTFDRDMQAGAAGERFQVGGRVVEGCWSGARRWVGKLRTPATAEFAGRRGYQQIAVAARARKGDWYDADEAVAGRQEGTPHEVLFDAAPLSVERVRVRADGREIYDGAWRGGPDYDRADNWLRTVLKAVPRTFTLARAAEPPASGQGEIRIELSRDAPGAPTVTVGGAPAAMTGKGRTWMGRFDFAAAGAGRTAEIPISISVDDGLGRGFDANPGTPLALETRAQLYGRRWWATYEDSLSGPVGEAGGPDTRHKLGRPPEGSLALIIDRSGSMEQGGRLDAAKAGVLRTLAALPAQRRIEVAVVAFDGCGGPRVQPFTQDRAAVRAFVEGIGPGGSTAIAEAHRTALRLFADQAHPASKTWRYVTFTDGVETCDGDVAAAMRELETLIAEHGGRARAGQIAQPVTTPSLPDVDCRPHQWRVYETKVQPVRVLPNIRLVEHWYFERELPDGRCMVRLATTEYGVFYGESGGRRRHGINSRPSAEKVDFASSQNGRAGIARVRGLADAARGRSQELGQARAALGQAVAAALDRTAAAPPGIGSVLGGWIFWPALARRRRREEPK